jgi:hypothetical protein
MGEANICAPPEFFFNKIALKLKQFLILFEKIIFFNDQIKTNLIISSWVLQKTERFPHQKCEPLNNNLL